jgi:hypothetical protein
MGNYSSILNFPIILSFKDFQLYADIARELPLIKSDHSSSESIIDDDTSKTIGQLMQLNVKEYL